MAAESGTRPDGGRARRKPFREPKLRHLDCMRVAAALGGSQQTVESLVRSGVLHPVTVDGKEVYLREDVDRLLGQWGVQTLPLEGEAGDDLEPYLEPEGGAPGQAEGEAPAQGEGAGEGQGDAEQ